MLARAEVLGDETLGEQETLGVAWRFKPLPVSLSLACWLMRILCTVVQTPMLPGVEHRQHLALGGPIALQFIGDEDARHVGQPLEELAKELLCGLPGPPAPECRPGGLLADGPGHRL